MRDLVLRWGYRKVCMQDVADAAHVGKGTLYLHWSSKDELLDAVLVRDAGRIDAELGAALLRRPELVAFGTTAAMLYHGTMSVPLLGAYNRGDTAVLGSRGARPGTPDRLGLSLVSRLADPRYLGALSRHHLVIGDARSESGRLAVGAVVGGFVLRPEGAGDVGRAGDCARLLGTVLQRSFGQPVHDRHDEYEAAVAETVSPEGRWIVPTQPGTAEGSRPA
ncbi:TetR/AcrR family transcriptional regulator [Rathayibacter sp. VKM Ac-2857]|uniref:TetR/AcrR family transcriptional regulator n=1 Tax=Rathayibacter sp. VKM Ac-2857 TaxID=2739020 RepID=UPI001563609E|nr:TetR/AcrR family transcriptional regulator [Rathayibacter sp. VKM Ac-2857]NQX15284.1 TetR/AcrR family transcriptional regulator [Rathayibacter sp. VKM Ac-2857]